MTEEKSYQIPKHLVWGAWKQVKANRGSAGVDGVSIEEFEKDLKRNLYKIWNRMSSGTYFPPPVRFVKIPKANGGKRPLGIPSIADRVAQTVAKMVMEPTMERIFHPDSLATPSSRAALAIERARSSSTSSRQSATRLPKESDKPFAHGDWVRPETTGVLKNSPS